MAIDGSRCLHTHQPHAPRAHLCVRGGALARAVQLHLRGSWLPLQTQAADLVVWVWESINRAGARAEKHERVPKPLRAWEE